MKSKTLSESGSLNTSYLGERRSRNDVILTYQIFNREIGMLVEENYNRTGISAREATFKIQKISNLQNIYSAYS